MERGETGGFHGYSRTPQTSSGNVETSGMKLSEISMRSSEINTTNKNIHHSTTTNDSECTVREQDRFMPIANVIRIMRKILPPHAKISDDAKETIQECVSEFISFITGEANDRCQREQRKTITAEDVLWAMSKLGFDDYIEPLTLYLNRFRDFEGDRNSLVKRTVDFGAGVSTVAGFAPVFQLGHGFFGVAPMGVGMGGFMKEGSNAGSSQAGVAELDPYAHCNK
ncbi:unnamed protein product [Camellia sinensis]